ncbi:hypothetical protein ADEAN_000015600 [Angomonas deanei]|uniref:Uncharacterized protein n=1 Tax=Angomonas deanei TaxID=59799 RepID=A0A7G2C0A2_9TRYP|nr:hypothetical protein ADEAN_000015600 [Angomonas deanei]
MRIGLILSLHGFFVCAALIVLIVVFFVVNEKSFISNTRDLVFTNMMRSSSLMKTTLGAFEVRAKDAAASLARFNTSARFFVWEDNLANSTEMDDNVRLLISSWNTLGVTEMFMSYTLAAFEMWISDKTLARYNHQINVEDVNTIYRLYSSSGCFRNTSDCYYYDVDRNESVTVTTNISTGSYNLSGATVTPGAPYRHYRQGGFLGAPR